MEEYELPLFPLNTVLFPATLLPLRIFEPRYVDLIGRCMRDNSGFGVVALMSGAETGRPGQTHRIGTIARIIDFDQGTDGLLNIVIRGDERFHVRDTTTQEDNLLLAKIVELDNVAQLPIAEEFSALLQLLDEITSKVDSAQPQSAAPVTASQLAYKLAQYLPFPVPAKVAMLEIGDPLELLQQLSDHLSQLRHGNQ